jgi:hypothetical protein
MFRFLLAPGQGVECLHPRILPGLSLCPRGHTVRRDDVTYSVFCFADASHVERFCESFGGERFDPKDRGRGSAWS